MTIPPTFPLLDNQHSPLIYNGSILDSMHCSLKKSRSWLTGRYSVCFDAAIKISPSTLPLIVDGIVRHVIPDATMSNAVLKDLKGFDLPALNTAPKEEILLIKGEVPLHSTGDERNSFRLELFSNFKAFVGTHQIEHSTTELRRGVLPEFVRTRNIGRIFPLLISEVRLGLEQFTSQQFAFFGFTPEVTQRLKLEIKDGDLKVEITAEKLRSLVDLPFSASGVFQRLSQVLKTSINTDLLNGYLAELGNSGAVH